MIRVIDGEKLPAPEPPHWQAPNPLDYIDPFNPFVLVVLFFGGAFLRSMFGRLIGSVVNGGIIGLLAWLVVGSLPASILAGVVVFVVSMLAESFASAGPPPSRPVWQGWVRGRMVGRQRRRFLVRRRRQFEQ